jgi:hypothetical protein
MTTWDLTLRALPGVGLVKPGDDLAATIVGAADLVGRPTVSRAGPA